jgi:hypothetical protein
MHTRASMRARAEAGNCVRTCGKRSRFDSRGAAASARPTPPAGAYEIRLGRGAATAHADRTAHRFPIGVGDRPSRVAGPRPPCARARAAVTTSR